MLRKTLVTAILTVALLALIAVPAFAIAGGEVGADQVEGDSVELGPEYKPDETPDFGDGLNDSQQHELGGGGQANRPDESGTWYHDGRHEGDL